VPLLGVNHLEGHVLSALLERPVPFPFLALLVSGGHTSLYVARDLGRYACVGRTRDDAAGEAFDKAAMILGLGYPGGRAMDVSARAGQPDAVRFPRARLRDGGYDFSFSGLKTAVWQHVAAAGEVHTSDLAASVQEAIVDVLVDTSLAAAAAHDTTRLVVVGGVAANSRLRARLADAAAASGLEVIVPPPGLCTDNAAMIAYAGWRRLVHPETETPDDLDLEAEADLALEPGWRGEGGP
jgi:N6-L-threonylcarbamoyladenine synthase